MLHAYISCAFKVKIQLIMILTSRKTPSKDATSM